MIRKQLLFVVASSAHVFRRDKGGGGHNPDTCPSCGPNQTFSDYLWESSSPLENDALNTAFIQGLKSGTLDPVDFGRYILQDAVWCEETAKAFTRAAERMSYNNTELFHLRSYILQTAQRYQHYADSIYEDWHVTGASGIILNGGGRTFLDYEFMVADTMDPGYILVCLIPIEELWAWIGRQIMDEPTATFGAYDDFVHGSFDPFYDGFVEVEGYVNDLSDNGLIEEAKALEVFSNCMQGEVDFFEFAA